MVDSAFKAGERKEDRFVSRCSAPARAGTPVVTEDPFLLARSEQVDVLVDVTGSVEFGAQANEGASQEPMPVV